MQIPSLPNIRKTNHQTFQKQAMWPGLASCTADSGNRRDTAVLALTVLTVYRRRRQWTLANKLWQRGQEPGCRYSELWQPSLLAGWSGASPGEVRFVLRSEMKPVANQVEGREECSRHRVQQIQRRAGWGRRRNPIGREVWEKEEPRTQWEAARGQADEQGLPGV